MLSNAYFLAKFRFHAAENDPAKKLLKICKKNMLISPILLFTHSPPRSGGYGAAAGGYGPAPTGGYGGAPASAPY